MTKKQNIVANDLSSSFFEGTKIQHEKRSSFTNIIRLKNILWNVNFVCMCTLVPLISGKSTKILSKIICLDFPGDIWSATAPCSGQWTWTFFTENFSPLQYWVFIIKSAMKRIWGWLFACALVQKAVLYAGLMTHANFSNFFNVICRVWNFEFANGSHSHEKTKKYSTFTNSR